MTTYNVILAGQDSHVASVRAPLDARFVMTWDARAEDVCGLDYDYHEDGSIFVHQQPYIAQLLARYGLGDVHAGPATPLSDKFQVDPNVPDDSDSADTATDGFDILDLHPRAVLGELMFLRPTVPTFSRAVHTLATATTS